MKTNAKGMITNFLEKPAPDLDISDYKVNPKYLMNSLGEHICGMHIFERKTIRNVVHTLSVPVVVKSL